MTAIEPVTTNTFPALLDQMQSRIEAVLPAHLNAQAESFVRLFGAEATRTPHLMECTKGSIIGSLMLAGQLGLEPGRALGHIWFVPLRNRNLQGSPYECNPWIGYKGYLELAHRSARYNWIVAESFTVSEFESGQVKITRTPPSVERVFAPRMKRLADDPVLGSYCYAELTNGARLLEALDRADIDEIRAGSQGKNSDAWVNRFARMSRKSAIRRAFQGGSWPMDSNLRRAASLDSNTEELQAVYSHQIAQVAEQAEHKPIIAVSAIEDPETAARLQSPAGPATQPPEPDPEPDTNGRNPPGVDDEPRAGRKRSKCTTCGALKYGIQRRTCPDCREAANGSEPPPDPPQTETQHGAPCAGCGRMVSPDLLVDGYCPDCRKARESNPPNSPVPKPRPEEAAAARDFWMAELEAGADAGAFTVEEAVAAIKEADLVQGPEWWTLDKAEVAIAKLAELAELNRARS